MVTRKLGGWAAAVALALVFGIGSAATADYLISSGADTAKQDLKPAVSLPITRVVLFNSGVGYFSRSGEVVDDARVDLMFPEQDVNDLLKSMVLEDFDRGRIAAVSYDSREPIARTLSSFAVNLNGNPTFAGILGQMRGERVDVVYEVYLKKLSAQEKEIDTLTARQKKLAADEFAARKKYEEFLASVSD